jgi:hypothetical protein
VTTYSKEAHESIAKTASYRPRKSRYVRGSGEIAAPTPPTTTGMDKGRKSSGSTSSRVRLAVAMAENSEPTEQMPTLARSTPPTAAAERGAKKSANAGSATTSAARRNAVAGCKHEAVERAGLPLGFPGAREAEQGGEDERDPEEAVRGVLADALGKSEVEDDEGCHDEQQHRGQRVPRAELEAQVLVCERRDVGGEGAHANWS